MANADNTIRSTQRSNGVSCVIAVITSAFEVAACNRSQGPSNITNITVSPISENASSLTRDSIAMARIRPSWCSVASVCRVPKMAAKAASTSVTKKEMSDRKKVSVTRFNCSTSTITATDEDTALSCSAM